MKYKVHIEVWFNAGNGDMVRRFDEVYTNVDNMMTRISKLLRSNGIVEITKCTVNIVGISSP